MARNIRENPSFRGRTQEQMQQELMFQASIRTDRATGVRPDQRSYVQHALPRSFYEQHRHSAVSAPAQRGETVFRA